jgi:hypothetical protein
MAPLRRGFLYADPGAKVRSRDRSGPSISRLRRSTSTSPAMLGPRNCSEWRSAERTAQRIRDTKNCGRSSSGTTNAGKSRFRKCGGWAHGDEETTARKPASNQTGIVLKRTVSKRMEQWRVTAPIQQSTKQFEDAGSRRGRESAHPIAHPALLLHPAGPRFSPFYVRTKSLPDATLTRQLLCKHKGIFHCHARSPNRTARPLTQSFSRTSWSEL